VSIQYSHQYPANFTEATDMIQQMQQFKF